MDSKRLTSEQFYATAKQGVGHARAQDEFAYQYVRKSNQQGVTAHPIFNKLHSGNLNLVGYRMQPGQVDSLIAYMNEHLQDLEVKNFLLHNNCIREQEFCQVMKALATIERQPLKNFCYSENEMGLLSVEHLGTILAREYPNNLKTLALGSLKIQIDVATLLCEKLLPSDQLLRLVLKDIPLNTAAVTHLMQALSSNFAMQDLQIVNCSLAPQDLQQFTSSFLTSQCL